MTPCNSSFQTFVRFAAVFVISILSLAGCSSSGPKLSGFGLGHTRVVASGDVLTLHTPLTESGYRAWRVVEYDSLHFNIVQRPTVVPNPDGGYMIETKARAKAPGTTEVVLERIGTLEQGESRFYTFKVRITP